MSYALRIDHHALRICQDERTETWRQRAPRNEIGMTHAARCTPARLLQQPVLLHGKHHLDLWCTVVRGPCTRPTRGVKLFSAAPQTTNVTQSLSRALSHLRRDKLTHSLFAQRAPRSLPRILPPLPPTSNQLARPGQIVRRSNQASSTHHKSTPPEPSAPDLPK